MGEEWSYNCCIWIRTKREIRVQYPVYRTSSVLEKRAVWQKKKKTAACRKAYN